MAKYNAFVVLSTKTGRIHLITPSARKVARFPLAAGLRVEVWNESEKVDTIYSRTRQKLAGYVAAEREYIRQKQAAAERRNAARRVRL